MSRWISLVAVSAIAVLAAGCGNSEQNDYVDQVNELQNQLVAQVSDAVGGAAPTTPKEAAAVAADLEQIFSQSADDFAAVTPPDEVADLHGQLVDQIRQIADQIKQAEQAFNSGDAQAASQAAIELQTATSGAQTQLNSIIDQINAQFGN